MSGNVRYTLKMDPTEKILMRRSMEKNGNAQRFFTHEVRRLADPYVPLRNGPLKNTAREEVTRIVYIQPYAKKQWEQNKGNGLRGKEWVLRMWVDRHGEIVKSVAVYVGGRPG